MKNLKSKLHDHPSIRRALCYAWGICSYAGIILLPDLLDGWSFGIALVLYAVISWFVLYLVFPKIDMSKVDQSKTEDEPNLTTAQKDHGLSVFLIVFLTGIIASLIKIMIRQ